MSAGIFTHDVNRLKTVACILAKCGGNYDGGFKRVRILDEEVERPILPRLLRLMPIIYPCIPEKSTLRLSTHSDYASHACVAIFYWGRQQTTWALAMALILWQEDE